MQYKHIIIVCLMLMISGCARYKHWYTYNFMSDGIDCSRNVCEAQKYICAKRIYNCFKTIALIDVLWLSPVVRETFINLRVDRLGLSAQEEIELAEQEREAEYKAFVFYVLMPTIEGGLASEKTVLEEWGITLCVDNKIYRPSYVKPVELSPEYKHIFAKDYYGETYIRFRLPYRVEFSIYDDAGTMLIPADAQTIKIILKNNNYCVCCHWDKTHGVICV